MRRAVIEAIREHAAAESPREACGFVVATGKRSLKVVRARNASADPKNFFRIAPEEFLAAEKLGTITHVYHTHPFGRAVASAADRAACQAANIPFLIVAHPVDEHVVVEPNGWIAPLYGREFVHGVHDCYGFLRDYYRSAPELAGRHFTLDDFHREDEWWRKGQDLYASNFAAQGFVEVSRDPAAARPHDTLLMRVGAAVKVENHAAIYLGNGAIGHHLYGSSRLSCREFYSQFWKDCTARVIRHRVLA